MVNTIVAVVVLGILVSALLYVKKATRKGARCIGCPYSGKGQCCCESSEIV